MTIEGSVTVRQAWLGLGGNIGDVEASMRRAMEMLVNADGVSVEAVSSLYATPPWGKTDQPDFLNACVRVTTSLCAEDLLDLCLRIEQGLSRRRRERWGPRSMDIDILAIDNLAVVSQRLTVPHPRLTERAFALMPLAEISPELEISGRSVAAWLAETGSEGIRKLKSGDAWAVAR